MPLVVGSGAGSTRNPKAALYFSSSVVTLGTGVAPARSAIGGADGTTQRATANFMENGNPSATTDAGGQQDNATAVQMNGPANVNREAEARWSAWANGGSNLAVDDVAATAKQVVGLYFFDGDWLLKDFTGHATANSANSETALPFEPNIAILFGHYDAFSADGTFTDMRVPLGIVVRTPAGTIQQVAFTKYVKSRNGLNTANAAALRDDSCFATFTQSADSARLEFTAWLSNGGTLTTRGASVARTCSILWGRIPNRPLWLGILPTSNPGGGLPWLSTASTGMKTVSVGIEPEFYSLIGTGLATANTRDTTTATNGWSWGWWTRHEQFVLAGHEPHGAGTVESWSHLSTSEIARVISLVAIGSPTTDWAAAHGGVDPTGPIINVTNASAAGRLTALLVVGALQLTPTAVTCPLVAPNVARTVTCTPTPATAPLVAPSVTRRITATPNVAQVVMLAPPVTRAVTCSPTPAMALLVAPPVTRSLTCTPGAAALALVAPPVTRALTCTPAAALCALVAPSVTRSATSTPSPVVCALVAPSVARGFTCTPAAVDVEVVAGVVDVELVAAIAPDPVECRLVAPPVSVGGNVFALQLDADVVRAIALEPLLVRDVALDAAIARDLALAGRLV